MQNFRVTTSLLAIYSTLCMYSFLDYLPRSHGSILVGKDLPLLEWWQETVVYQIYPRSFQDSDGDGTGDLKGIQSRLDYLVDLGVGAVWLSPIYKSPMVDFGYDISDFNDIDPIFGTLNDFKELATAMQDRGIKVIMDFIPNHSSNQHPWFQSSIKREDPYTNYYTWQDPIGYDNSTVPPSPIPPSNWICVWGRSMWEWNDERQQFYLHQFGIEMPDIRFETPEASQALMDSMEFWMNLGVDGFRVDAVPHMFEDQNFPDESKSDIADPDMPETEYWYWNHTYTRNLPEVRVELRKYRELIDRKNQEDGKIRAMMTEGYVTPLSAVMEYYGTDDAPIAHFPFNFELIGLPEFSAGILKGIIDSWMEAMPPGRWANWLVGNHDNSRVSNRFGPQLIDAMNMIVLLLPGTAVTYYGEELGMEDTFLTWEETRDRKGCEAGPDRYHVYSRDPERTPMQWDNTRSAGFSTNEETWLPINKNYVSLNVKAQMDAEESHLKVYKSLLALRKTEEWKFGKLETRTFGNIFGLRRNNATHGFLAFANFGDEIESFDASVFEGVPSTGTVYSKSVGFGDSSLTIGSVLNFNALKLEPNNSFVLRYDNNEGSSTRRNTLNIIGIMSGLIILKMF